MIDAPSAWGCSTGDSTTQIAVIDHGFRDPPDLYANAHRTLTYALDPPDTATHGLIVTGVFAAKGNDSTGISGVMWNVDLDLQDAQMSPGSNEIASGADPYQVGYLVAELGRDGVRVVNISLAMEYFDATGAYRAPLANYHDSSTALYAVDEFLLGVNTAHDDGIHGPLPLLVIAAGNFAQPGASGTTDAWWAGLPILHDSLGANAVLVVGASTADRTIANFSGVNTSAHQYVDIVAPGQGVYSLDRNGNPQGPIAGTSVATPYVTGTAGLLLSFDPRLSQDSLRQLVLDGAAVGNRSVAMPGGARYLVNAYEPLRLAAKRTGAPLCGNRVWADSGHIIVQRDSATPERLESIGTLSSTDAFGTMSVEQGGKRIGVCDGLTCTDELDYGKTGWVAGSGFTYQTNSGGARSSAGYSHDVVSNDTVVDAQPIGGDRTRWSIGRTIGTGSRSQLVEIDINHAPPGVSFAFYHAQAAFPPRGAGIIVFTHKEVQVTADGPIVDTSWVYSVPKQGASSATLLWTTPVQLEYESISEDGAQLATVVLSNATSPETCHYRYYSLVAPIPLDGQVLSDHQTSDLVLCDALPGIAPRRVSTGGTRPGQLLTPGGW